jgi:hypothetical protein
VRPGLDPLISSWARTQHRESSKGGTVRARASAKVCRAHRTRATDAAERKSRYYEMLWIAKQVLDRSVIDH